MQCHLPLPRKRLPDGASQTEVAEISLQPTPHLSTPKGWKAESTWLADLQWTVLSGMVFVVWTHSAVSSYGAVQILPLIGMECNRQGLRRYDHSLILHMMFFTETVQVNYVHRISIVIVL